MIPYLERPSLRIRPVTVHAFGVIIAAAVLIGLEIGRRQFARRHLDAKLGERIAWWTIVGAFLGAHLSSVVLDFPEELAADPLLLLRVWEDISTVHVLVGAGRRVINFAP